jgi:hypothetical protein
VGDITERLKWKRNVSTVRWCYYKPNPVYQNHEKLLLLIIIALSFSPSFHPAFATKLAKHKVTMVKIIHNNTGWF